MQLQELEFKNDKKPFWEERKDKHPYHAFAKTGQPAPQILNASWYHFVCVPLGDGFSVWGFDKEENRDRFCTHFQASKIEYLEVPDGIG